MYPGTMSDDAPHTPEDLIRTVYGNDELAGLAALHQLRADLLEREQQLVVSARIRRRTWAEIGAALGTSRQGAFNRFGDVMDRFERTGVLVPVSATGDLELDSRGPRQPEA